ncbi:MAG: LamG domain-containing protein [Solirubrobacterales bacterium]
MNAELQTPRSGPVASYAFDENEGTVAEDHAGGHDGTIEGATWTKGKFGSALDFEAAEEDVVTIPTSEDLNLEDFTLEAWVKPSEVNELLPVIAKGSGEGFGYALYGAGAEEPFVPTGYIFEGESVKAFATGEEELSTKAWTHVAVTSDGNKLRFYVNGKLVDTRTGANLVAGGETDLHIGGDTSIFNPTYFDGKIDEVRIYGRALSEAEINTDLHSGIQTPQTGPIAAYSLDAGTGEVAEDVTANEHEGTIEGATWTPRGNTVRRSNSTAKTTASKSPTPKTCSSTKNSPSRPG